ncbi:MAG TPA: prepilin-type N-terminal cleavage/methylation domain-containing protein, partial [Lacipirellulaceae bacterium]|nr:prepilin-type N-terminal cleavage/methylation domain-containing protein [Lacipirellulaceae bacterium]
MTPRRYTTRTRWTWHAHRRAFTLFEVVLAIALSAVVVYLLTTATELYMVNIDATRNRVETAQLARTLLDQIA